MTRIEPVGYQSEVTFTRPANTTAYDALDVQSDSTTTPSVLTFAGIGPALSEIKIQSATMRTNVAALPVGQTTWRLHLYTSRPTPINDNAPYNLPSGDRTKYVGYVELGTPLDNGDTLWSQVHNVGKQITLVDGNLYGILQTVTGFTPTSAVVKTIELNSVLVSGPSVNNVPWGYNPLWKLARTVPTLDLRFADSKSLVDTISNKNLITFTRASEATFVNSQGQIQTAAINEPRFDHNPTTGESLGLLVEEQRTNSIRNNTMVGAVAGTPGTLPTNWPYAVAGTGITRQIVGTGVENGINYIDFRFSGTSGSTTVVSLGIDRAAALTTQSWTASLYWKLVAGSTSGVTEWQLGLIEETSANAFVAGTYYTVTTPTASLSRVSASRTLSGGATVANVLMPVLISCTNGVAIDFTLRIGMPQLEQGAFATSVIPTTGTAATRSADVASISGSNFSSWYRQDEGTMFADCANARPVSGGNQFTFRASDGTYTNNVVLNIQSSGLASLSTAAAGVFDGIVTTATGFSANVQSRMAGAYKSNDLACCFAGGALATDATVTIPTALTRADIGSDHAGLNRFGSGHIRRLTYWPQRLGNAVLQRITQ